MRILQIIIIMLFAGLSCYAQSSFVPRNLGKAVNSEYDEINPVPSPDGKLLFFVRINHPENTFGQEDSEDIWYCERINDSTWTQAKRLANLNIGRYNAVLGFNKDGKEMILNGVFNKRGTIWKKRGLSLSTKNGNEWSTPMRLKANGLSKKNRGLYSSGSPSADGRIIVLSFSSTWNSKKNNLYLIERQGDGNWSRPKKLTQLNSGSSEIAPQLSTDLKSIYFSSDRSGEMDIYKSTRQDTQSENWLNPIKVSDTINSPKWDAYFRTTQKDSWAYFASTNESMGGADIYKVKLFEANPFVELKGKIVHSQTKAPLIGKAFEIMVNGAPADSLIFNKDSATYKLVLPLKKKYTLTTQLSNYTSQPVEVDVTGKREFLKMNVDLPATPFPYVLVKGQIRVQNTGMPVAVNLQTKVWVNQLSDTSAKIDAIKSSYTLRLNHGKTYQLSASALKHEPIPVTLDLTKIYEYQEVEQDLYVLEEKMATVTGKILDKKTGKPLAKLSVAKVMVEGLTTIYAQIDTLTGDYDLKLPLGVIYTISASAPNYYPLYESVNVALETNNVKMVKDLVVVPIEVGQSIRLNNIFFDPAKAILKPESYPELDRVAEFLTNNATIKVEIGGHTDNVGSAATNQKLSQNRAQAVADYIISKGISKDRVVAKGYGLSKPVASNATKEGKAQNRRVEFTVVGN